MAEFVTGTGQELTKVHESWRCWGRWCVIHKPMPGPWSSWPTHWREDAGFMERICPCGVGHPVAETVLLSGRIHGCCGEHRCFPTPQEWDGEAFIEGEIVYRELES